MEVSNIGNVLGNSSTSTSPEKILGKDDFLRLLVTQLSYQDPLNPLKATDFSAQLAQFSSVEQLFNIDDTLKASLDANYLLATSINNTMAAMVIGKEVRAVGDQVYFDGDVATNIVYDLPENATSVTIEVVDQNGQVKRTVQLDNVPAGENEFSWDGKDNSGNVLPEGTYQVRIKAENRDGEDISATTYISGIVSGLRYSTSGPVLMLGNLEIRLSDVYEIHQP
ncbi:MAG: flagellar hook capping protein [Calditrichaeota bacterium]|nr:MAG: flagellar hook capping protein [Calditrichota bacterium]